MDITSELTTEEAVEAAETPEAADERSALRLLISAELIIYLVLIGFSLTLRLIQVGSIPLNDQESYEALAAFRVIEPRAAGPQLVAHNPLMFTANALTMALTGSGTANARIPTILVGVMVVTLPLGFRRWLGPANALIAAGLLALSPVLLAASRSMSGAVWSSALVLVGVYLAGRFVETRRAIYAIAASIAFLMLVVAAESAGFLMALGLVIGLIFAMSTVDDPDHRYRQTVQETLRQWPWIRSITVGGLLTALVAMVFLLYPAGLSGIGDVLDQAIKGLISRPAGYPFAFPLLTSLLYEPVLWVFGLTGAVIVLRRDGDAEGVFIQRILVGWLIASVAWALVYAGVGPDHALWLTLPLVGLSAVSIERIFTPIRDQFWDVPAWGPWIHGAAVFAILCIAGINLLLIGRSMVSAAPDALPRLERPMQMVMIFPALLLVVITFFLVGSMWGSRAAWRGTGIGVLIFLSVYSLSAGWRTAVVNADNPRELFLANPVSGNLDLMESTLIIASRRATSAPYDMPITVQITADGPSDRGALAWALRYFYHTSYMTGFSADTNTPVIITPQANSKPALNGSYVGESFPITHTWNRTSLSWDLLAWLYARDSREAPAIGQQVIVWVRGDVYGVMSSTAPNSAQ